MKLKEAISIIEAEIPDPKIGLPIEIFNLISRLTPLVNVDLLIKDENNRTLLSWRDDQFSGIGWHIPGGIVRFKETLATRINQTAQKEIGCLVEFNPTPIAINEINCSHITRGHFISFLYECNLTSTLTSNHITENPTDPGYLRWHDKCPLNIIPSHEIYRQYI